MMEETKKIRSRQEIPVADTWALEDLYVTDAAWEEELQSLAQDQALLPRSCGSISQ